MILKFFEINKLDLRQNKILLFYGNNSGLKKKIIQQIKSSQTGAEVFNFEENNLLNNNQILYNQISNMSFFENQKIIIINYATDKIKKIILEINANNLKDIILIINAENLDKNSKLRSFFEKDPNLVCIPFYPDTTQTLSLLAIKFFREKKISISQTNINLIINKCNGDRGFLENELNKIELFLYKKKSIETEQLSKLINLIENHSILELVDGCLINNSKKVSLILNENTFNNEDCIIIIKTFLAKTKKILKLANNYVKNNNLEMTISESRPPIFWKEKDTVKQQLQKWKPDMLKKLIANINQVELELKKNSQSSLSILMNFIFEQISIKA